MGKIVAVLGVLLTLAACGVGGWVVVRPSVALFVVPGATDIQVAALAWNTWQISYRAPGEPTTWFPDLGRQLEAHQWSNLDRVEYSGYQNHTYSHAVSFGVGELWEWAYFSFDSRQPHAAHISIRHWIRRSLVAAPPRIRIMAG